MTDVIEELAATEVEETAYGSVEYVARLLQSWSSTLADAEKLDKALVRVIQSFHKDCYNRKRVLKDPEKPRGDWVTRAVFDYDTFKKRINGVVGILERYADVAGDLAEISERQTISADYLATTDPKTPGRVLADFGNATGQSKAKELKFARDAFADSNATAEAMS